jgi:hypothetical protein
MYGSYTSGLDVIRALWSVPALGVQSRVDIDPGAGSIGLTRVFDVGGSTTVLGTTNTAGYYVDTALVPATQSPRDFFVDDDGVIWAVTQPTGSSTHFGLLNLSTSVLTDFTGTASARSGPNSARACFVSSTNSFFVVTDAVRYIIDRATMTVTSSSTSGYVGAGDVLPIKNASQVSFWNNFSEYSLIDGSLIRTVSGFSAPSSNFRRIYDPINHAIIVRPQFEAKLYWDYLDRHGAYRVAGPVYSTQEFLEVEEMFANATAGNLVTHEGALELEPGQAKSVSSTFTDDDLIVGSTTTYNQGFLSESSGEWLNSVVANYIEPEQKWNAHDAPIARDTDDIIADGKPREATVTLRLVRYLEQAQRIAEISRRKGRLWGRAQVTLGPRFCEIEAGDWVTWTSDRYNFTKTFEVRAGEIDEKWQNRLTLAEINGSVFADDADFTTDRSQVAPPPIIPDIGTPTDANWTLTATTLTSTGASIPAILQ